MGVLRWLAGLRIRTAAWQRLQDGMMDEACRRYLQADAQARMAEREKREAQRLLTIIAEPLKDWDLADFAGAEFGGRLLASIRDAYQTVSPELARIRMSAKVNDKARRRGWDDKPLPPPAGVRIPTERPNRKPLP